MAGNIDRAGRLRLIPMRGLGGPGIRAGERAQGRVPMQFFRIAVAPAAKEKPAPEPEPAEESLRTIMPWRDDPF
jgi:hypothetical protein